MDGLMTSDEAAEELTGTDGGAAVSDHKRGRVMPIVKSHHRIITDECRANRTDAGALDEAIATSRRAIQRLYEYWPNGHGTKIHIKVEVEYQVDEQQCPGHVASETNVKVCGRCGVNIDSLRPEARHE